MKNILNTAHNEPTESGDGVALQSRSHPYPEARIEAVCRAICRAEGIDPDEREIVMGTDQGYPRWETRRAQALAALEADALWEFQNPVPETINPRSLMTICAVCNIDFGMGSWNYVCTNPNCPTSVRFYSGEVK